MSGRQELLNVLDSDFETVLAAWIGEQSVEGVARADLIPPEETRAQSREILAALREALREGGVEAGFDAPCWDGLRGALQTLTEARIERGVAPTEIAWFALSLKRAAVKGAVDDAGAAGALDVADGIQRLIDRVALFALETYVDKREAVIERQREEMNEVSAPVVKLWDRIVTVPLIGTLDSWRAQTVMEALLEAIVQREAEVAIIDITGVGTVDTMVAQHLLKTAAAVRLMGAECVICGVSPKIAQTIVHLGVDLPNVATRIDLQSGLDYAFRRIGLEVRPRG